jgi:hypothetical protein
MIDFEHLKFSRARGSFPDRANSWTTQNRRSVQEALERSLAAADFIAVVTTPRTIAARISDLRARMMHDV